MDSPTSIGKQIMVFQSHLRICNVRQTMCRMIRPPTATTTIPSVTSPGGSTYSSPRGSPSATSSSSPQERSYHHSNDGWLSISSTPASQQQRSNNSSGGGGINRSPSTGSRTASRDNDPIARLLRAPRKRSPDGNYNNYAPTLIDALSAESIHRPSVKFNFPLNSLSITGTGLCVDDWETVFWGLIEREMNASAANNNAGAGSGATRGGGCGIGSLQGGAGGDPFIEAKSVDRVATPPHNQLQYNHPCAIHLAGTTL